MDYTFLRQIREWELLQVLQSIPPGSRVLEIGAGAGWQALQLTQAGMTVEAIDIAENSYAPFQVFPVREYDGVRVPFDNASFDVVYTSHTLIRIKRLDVVMAEAARALKPGGQSIHVLPTSSWRLWTTLVHYPYYARLALQRLLGRKGDRDAIHQRIDEEYSNPAAFVAKAMQVAAVPRRLGVRGNVMSELFTFSQRCWEREFRRLGWRVVDTYLLPVLYTGYFFFGGRLPLTARHSLSRILGRSVRVFVLTAEHTAANRNNPAPTSPDPDRSVYQPAASCRGAAGLPLLQSYAPKNSAYNPPPRF
jgi:ubiquinone/menaquinone biosynthesis C-methylase UbiE